MNLEFTRVHSRTFFGLHSPTITPTNSYNTKKTPIQISAIFNFIIILKFTKVDKNANTYYQHILNPKFQTMRHPSKDLTIFINHSNPKINSCIIQICKKLQNPKFKITKLSNKAYNTSTSNGKNCKVQNYTVAQNPTFQIQN